MADDPGLVKEVFELRQLLGAQITERQRQMKRHRNQILFVAVGGLLGLLLVAFRGELNAKSILDSRYDACVVRADQIRAFNVTQDVDLPVPICVR
jgi:hypothetical protein